MRVLIGMILTVWSTRGINWNDFQSLTTSGINWNDIGSFINTLSESGINWVDLATMTKAGLNWNDLTVSELKQGSIGMILEY